MTDVRTVGLRLRWSVVLTSLLVCVLCAPHRAPAESERSGQGRVTIGGGTVSTTSFRMEDGATHASVLAARRVTGAGNVLPALFAPIGRARAAAAAKPKPYFGLRWDATEPARAPDCSIAKSPTHTLQAVNSRVTVLDAAGRIVLNDGAGNNFRRLRDVFSTIPDAEDVEWFGPRCLFDTVSGRFILAVAGADFTAQDEAWLAIAVSAGADPLQGEWTVRGYRTDIDGGNPVSRWADSLDIGLDGTFLVAAWNDHAFSNNALVHSRLWSFDRAAFLDGSDTTYGEISGLRDSGAALAQSVKPCRHHGANDAFYLVSSKPLGGATLELWRLTGTPQAPVIASVVVNDVTNYETPPNARQPGIALNTAHDALETGDCRIQSAVADNNRVWTSLNSSIDGVIPDAAIHVTEMDGPAGTVVQSRGIGARGSDYFNAALDTTTGRKPGTVIVFSSSSKKLGAGLRYCTRLQSMPPGQFRISKAIITGNGRYDPLAPRSPGEFLPPPQWGRYCSAVRDPAKPEQVLLAGPFADVKKSRSIRAWATRLKNVTP